MCDKALSVMKLLSKPEDKERQLLIATVNTRPPVDNRAGQYIARSFWLGPC